jgi:multidrug resistance efflux pump
MARQARDTLERTRDLHARGLATPAELVRAEADTERARTAVAAQRLAVERIQREGRRGGGESEARVSAVEREIAALTAEELILATRAARLDHEISLHAVRASVAGTVAELRPLPVGSLVAAGERLAAIVPDGGVILVADFAPATRSVGCAPDSRRAFA